VATMDFRHGHTQLRIVGEISCEPGAEDNDGLSRRACTAASEEQSASAGHHASAVTDHARTS